MQRTLTRSYFEHVPPAPYAKAIEELMGDGIPELRLKRQPGALARGVAEEILITPRAARRGAHAMPPLPLAPAHAGIPGASAE